MENNTTFDRLQNAPASMFKNVTAPMENGSSPAPENAPSSTTGEVSEADALAGAQGAEISQDVPPTAQPGATGNPDTKGKLGHLLNAKTAIGIVDAVLPAIAVILMQYFMSVKMNKRELQLNESERAIIAVPLQNWLNSVVVDFDSPLNALLITVGAVYGSKFAEKGFAAYFDKRDADNLEKERLAKIKKENKAIVLDMKPEITMTKPATTDTTNEWGYTEAQMLDGKKRCGNKFANSKQVAAFLRREETSK